MSFPELRRPIVLAPMAGGPSTPELAAAVTNAGGLGFLAAGYLTADALGDRLRRARQLSSGPLAVNLFVLADEPVDTAALAAYARELEPDVARLGVQLGKPRYEDDRLREKLELLERQPVDVVSTTFGRPTPELVERLHAVATAVWATVTSADEAVVAGDAGVDALVVQGPEAGGHRGSWGDAAHTTPLLPLLREVAAEVDLPLIAAGGIADRAGVEAVLAAGARAAQIGTAFLLCPEAGTGEPHREALRAGGETGITRAFSGRRARGIVNGFMRAHPDAPSAYPHVHHLTAPLRAAARAAGDREGFNLWAGAGFEQAREQPAAEVVARLSPAS
ncbi:MAG: NAD(P)H-dependent flavin oxidoreductase [Gaiellaceae bacterium]